MTMIAKKFPTAALIDGEWVTSAKTFSVTDPATGAEVAAVPDLGAEDAARAIDAAASALPAWSAKTAKERATILRRWFDLVTAETESLAQLMTTEQGKPLAEARAEVGYGASFIEWFAEEGKRAYGRTIPTTVASKRYLTIKQPIGVVAAIAPWNFPIAMITRKVAPALAAGCTIVVKPAAETPLCALAIAKLALDAGVPPGVLNIVTTKDAPAVGQGVLRRWPGAQALLHRLDRGRQDALPAMRRHGEEAHARARRQRAAASCSTTPISTRRSPAPWPPNTAMPARPASAPIASWCSPASTTASRRPSSRRSRSSPSALAWKPAPTIGPLINERGDRQGRDPCRRRRQEGRKSPHRRHAR